MQGLKNYERQSWKEKQQIMEDVTKALTPKGLELTSLELIDDGYLVSVEVLNKEKEYSFTTLCAKVDELKFQNYEITNFCFSKKQVKFSLAPKTEEAINNFVWNYILTYFPSRSETQSLAIAIGVVERMMESLSDEAKQAFDRYISKTIN